VRMAADASETDRGQHAVVLSKNYLTRVIAF